MLAAHKVWLSLDVLIQFKNRMNSGLSEVPLGETPPAVLFALTIPSQSGLKQTMSAQAA